MRLPQTILILLYTLVSIFACNPTNIVPPEPEPKPQLIGNWVSEGSNIADLWVDSIAQIELRFFEDSIYVLTHTLINDSLQFFAGQYEAVDSLMVDGIAPITFFQLEPDTVTYKGIYEVEDLQEADRLTLEVVRTFPNAIYLPPTILGGFGSTDEVNLGVGNVQQYRRME